MYNMKHFTLDRQLPGYIHLEQESEMLTMIAASYNMCQTCRAAISADSSVTSESHMTT
jgi:hypothetical protein